LGSRGRLLRVAQVFEQDAELVATEACHRVARSQAGAQALPDRVENRVPGSVAKTIVDQLETVQIEEQNRQAAAGTLAAGQGMVDAVGKEAAVGQAGQWVGQRRLDELLLHRRVLERDADVVGKELDQVEVLLVEVTLFAVQVERTDDAVGSAHRRDDQRFLLILGRAGNVQHARVVEGVVDQLRLALGDDVAGDAAADLHAVGQDLLRVRVTGEDRDQIAGGAVDCVDGQRVVRHDLSQCVGNGLEHRVTVAGQQQSLGDRQQLVLAGQSSLEGLAAPLELLVLARVVERHRRLRADDLGQAQVGRIEGARAEPYQFEDADDGVLVDQGHDDHRLVDIVRSRDLEAARVVTNVGHDFGNFRRCHRAGEALANLHLQQLLAFAAGVVRNSSAQHDLLQRLAIARGDEEA
jgi:hypothetical protein